MPNAGRTTIQAMAMTTSEIAPASTKEISPVPMPMRLPIKGTTLPRMLSGRMRAMNPKLISKKPPTRASQVMKVLVLAAFLNIVSVLTLPDSMKLIQFLIVTSVNESAMVFESEVLGDTKIFLWLGCFILE